MSVIDDPILQFIQEVARGYYPTRPTTYGANPYQPNPQLPSRYEGMAALKGGWEKPKPPARRVRRKRKR